MRFRRRRRFSFSSRRRVSRQHRAWEVLYDSNQFLTNSAEGQILTFSDAATGWPDASINFSIPLWNEELNDSYDQDATIKRIVGWIVPVAVGGSTGETPFTGGHLIDVRTGLHTAGYSPQRQNLTGISGTTEIISLFNKFDLKKRILYLKHWPMFVGGTGSAPFDYLNFSNTSIAHQSLVEPMVHGLIDIRPNVRLKTDRNVYLDVSMQANPASNMTIDGNDVFHINGSFSVQLMAFLRAFITN